MNKERTSNGSAATGTDDCIKVAVRVRPLIESEINRGCQVIVQKTALSTQIAVNNKERFTFNYAFDMDETQEMVYANAVRPLVQHLFRGLNVTILAYGQTGSGKTHTMGTNFDGDDDNDDSGLIPRAIEQIFEHIDQNTETHDFDVTCSFIELYQEQLYDLLSMSPREQSVVDIREDSSRGVFIANLSEVPVKSAGDAVDCLMKGSSGRAVGATAMNASSSRSHAIYTVNIRMSNKVEPNSATTAKFHLVDLAGSERSAKTKATGQRFKEGVKINQGLLALGNVISALGSAQRSGGHVGYRDSKLTRLLQDSLGGNSVTLMIACVSPADYNSDETLSTLRYADRAKQIRNKPVVNQDPKTAEILRLRALVDKLRLELMNQVCVGIGGEDAAADHNPADLSVASPRAAKMRRMSGMPANSEELAKLRSENVALSADLAQQRQKLTRTLRNLSDVNMKFVSLEDRVEQLTERLRHVAEQLTEIVDAVDGGPNAEPAFLIDKSDQLRKLLETVQQTVNNPTVDVGWWPTSSSQDDESNADEEPEWLEAQEQQMQFNEKLIDIQQQIHIKSAVNARCRENYAAMQTFDEPVVDAERVSKLEEELARERQAHEELKKCGKTDRVNAKISEERRKKLLSLEAELKALNKLKEKQTQMQRQQEMYKKELERQANEMKSLKQARVKLTRDMKTMKDKAAAELKKRTHENTQLAAKARKDKTALTAKFAKSEKENMVMKVKMDYINQVNNRLKKAMENHTQAQRQRRGGANGGGSAAQKTADIQALIDNEVEVIYSVVDAKHSLQQLIDDRADMTGRMIEMRRRAAALSADESAELAQLKEDVEMRNVQIADMQEKIRSSNVDEKIKTIVDGLSSLNDSRTAVRYLFASLTELRMEYDTKATSVHDIRTAYDDLVEQQRAQAQRSESDLNEIRDECKRMRDEHQAIQHSYEEKVSLLLYHHHKRTAAAAEGDEPADGDGGVDATNDVHQRINDELVDALRAKIDSYEMQLQVQQAQLASMRDQRRVKARSSRADEIAFRSLSVSSEDAFEEDDSDNDPDWHKTPAAKERKRQPLRPRDSNTSDNVAASLANLTVTVAGDSTRHKCNCKGTCKTKVCGCRKAGLACSHQCGCVHERCENTADSSGLAADGTMLMATMGKEADETVVLGNEENQAIGLLSPLRPTMSVMDTTTPYPYENKKRKPLLDI